MLHFPHPKTKKIKKVHRLVILPDYQGLGFGIRFLNEIGYIYKSDGFRFTIVTSSPSLIHSLKRRKNWALKSFGRKKEVGKGATIQVGKTSKNRITASFELK